MAAGQATAQKALLRQRFEVQVPARPRAADRALQIAGPQLSQQVTQPRTTPASDGQLTAQVSSRFRAFAQVGR